jgi:hypothetical protein
MELERARGAEDDVDFAGVEQHDFFGALREDDCGVRLRLNLVVSGVLVQQQPTEPSLE